MRVGIDVGGTHTDAVIMQGRTLLASVKAHTTADVQSGVEAALAAVIDKAGITRSDITAVMIGTTQFTNAVVERQHLSNVASVRVSLPSGRGLPPMLDWPIDIRNAIGDHAYQVKGGVLYTGDPIAALDRAEIDKVIADISAKDIRYVAVSAAFSPSDERPEKAVADSIHKAIPGVSITRSAHFGRLGLLERENAATLNAALLQLADRVVNGFEKAIAAQGLTCPIFISQNDGTLMNADFVRRFPALTFSSGPTNSLRGAALVTGLTDAIVVDIGGTTSDIGVLKGGFPRDSQSVVSVGGVRTNFRMPDIKAIGIGGGSLVGDAGASIGPKSVGYHLSKEGIAFGGNTLTATDLVIASGRADFGDRALLSGIPKDTVARGLETIRQTLDKHIDQMRTSKHKLPVILVGGGALLVQGALSSASNVLRPANAGVTNAIGAAIAQVGGEAEKMVNTRDTPRQQAIEEVTVIAARRAAEAGADPNSLRRADLEETPVPYMDKCVSRIRVRMIGDLGILAAPRTGGSV